MRFPLRQRAARSYLEKDIMKLNELFSSEHGRRTLPVWASGLPMPYIIAEVGVNHEGSLIYQPPCRIHSALGAHPHLRTDAGHGQPRGPNGKSAAAVVR